MDFELPEHLKALRRTVRDYLEREVPRSRIRELDEQARFPYEEWEGIARLGLLGAPFPEEYGGAGGSILDEVVITEELARGFTALSFAYLVTVSFGGMSILWFGSEEQKRRYLPPHVCRPGPLRPCPDGAGRRHGHPGRPPDLCRAGWG